MHNCAILKIPFDISHLHLIFHNNTIARKGFSRKFLESQGLSGGFIRCYILRTGSCLLRNHAGWQKQQHEQHQWEQSESTDYRPPTVHTADLRPIELIVKLFHNLILYLLFKFNCLLLSSLQKIQEV